MAQQHTMKVDGLKTGFDGEVVLPHDENYDRARRIWNAMIDKRPAIIARCVNVPDVVRAVNFARENGLPLAVRGGGHHIAGNALVDDGLVVDLSLMKAVHVNVNERRVSVEGGATLADVDAATLAHGLATPLGVNSTTGIAGLTLGGGFGWLSRKYGMTVDNLLSAEVVTAAGEVVRASATENPDLFWALRGGSGNFGVVTCFEFQLHAVGPNLLSGLIVYPLEKAKPVLQKYRELAAKAPDELAVWAVLRKAPPLPFLPEAVHGKGIVVIAFLYSGDPGQGEALVEPLRHLDTPLGEAMGVQPFAAWQQALDPLLTPGARNYWKSHNFTTLADGLFEVVTDFVDRVPSPQCEVLFAVLGGATKQQDVESTAYAHRNVEFVMNVHGRWDDAADDERCVSWARDLFRVTSPFASSGVYVNFLTADETDRVRAAYGANYRRLAQVKRKFDPENLFRVNQNIAPA